MANDIFQFDAKYSTTKIVCTDNMQLTVEPGGGKTVQNYLVQNVQGQYQRPTQIIRELSSANGYVYGMPPQGQLSIDRVIGSVPLSHLMGVPGVEDAWVAPDVKGNRADVTMTLAPMNKGAGATYKMHGCIIISYSCTVDANRSLLSEAIQVMFGSLEIV